MKEKLRNFFKKLFLERWELTIYFPEETKVLPDGTRLETVSPKTYIVKRIKKLSHLHMIFIEENGMRHEIKVVHPVGYDLRKIF